MTTALVTLWDIFEQSRGQRLAASLKSELDRLQQTSANGHRRQCADAALSANIGSQLRGLAHTWQP